ncbi:FecR domain-containing protein [Limnohabitans sp. DM1]|uniref:FecR family protein n=1 Tax=Limnohabitans sp. DM1 TaxID=1597955 RepID=UPI000A7AF1FA|nr:FecR domain-containing protein [Limnohabitans sp. DM1]
MKNPSIWLLWLCCAASVQAAESAGTVKTLKGTAHIERGKARIEVAVGTSLQTQDRLHSGPASGVGITLRDSTLLTVGANSMIELNKYAFDRSTNAGQMDASIKRGTLAVVSGQIAKNNPNEVVFRTNTVTLGVRGTEFIIDVGEEAPR